MPPKTKDSSPNKTVESFTHSTFPSSAMQMSYVRKTSEIYNHPPIYV